MQMLNTDFQTEERGEWIAMDVIRRFNDQLELWEHSPGVDHGSACIVSPGSFAPELDGGLASLENFGQTQMGKVQKVFSHAMILGQRMILNYSRYVIQYFKIFGVQANQITYPFLAIFWRMASLRRCMQVRLVIHAHQNPIANRRTS